MVSPRHGRAEASAVIWRQARTLTGADAAKRARVRGALQAAVGAAVGGALILFTELQTLPIVMFAVAGVILFAALLSPTVLFAGLEHGLQAVAGRLGRGIMLVALAAVFLLFFVPFGALFRRGRRDRLKRFLEPEAETYWNWEPEEGPTAASRSLESQF